MLTKSHSQSGQDRFVDAILEGKRDGLFVDCGCNHPVELSNTYALETELGWLGLLVDNDEHCIRLCEKQRSKYSKVLMGDGTKASWAFGIGLTLHLFANKERWTGDRYVAAPFIDYLSLDCDAATLDVLQAIFTDVTTRFRVLTIETDLYRFGPGPRDSIDGLLKDHGYDVLCRNVRASDGSIYESWAVDPKLVNMAVAEKYRSDGLKWSEILAKA